MSAAAQFFPHAHASFQNAQGTPAAREFYLQLAALHARGTFADLTMPRAVERFA